MQQQKQPNRICRFRRTDLVRGLKRAGESGVGAEKIVHAFNGLAAFTDGSCAPFGRARSRIAGGEDAGRLVSIRNG